MRNNAHHIAYSSREPNSLLQAYLHSPKSNPARNNLPIILFSTEPEYSY